MHTLTSFCDHVERLRLAHSRIDDLLATLGKTPARKKDHVLRTLSTLCVMTQQLEREVDDAIVQIKLQEQKKATAAAPPDPRRALGSHVWNGPSEQI